MILDEQEWGYVPADPWSGFPPRTSLVRLPPMGQGSPFREHLGSYYMRLADAHSLQPSVLAWEFAFPERNKRITRNVNNNEESWNHPYFSGIGGVSEKWVPRLERLTGVGSLETLTLGFLSGLITTRGVVCPTPRWCPACFRDDSRSGTPYGRLLWIFKEVTCCPIHRTRLVSRCACGSGAEMKEKKARSLPNICPKCACDLGSGEGVCPGEATAGELHRTGLITDLLMSDLAMGDHHTGKDIADFLSDSITRYAEGVSSRFTKAIGVGNSSMIGWVQRDHVPGFDKIIGFAELHGCSIADVLSGRSENVTKNPVAHISRGDLWSKTKVRAVRRKLDWDAIALKLNELLHEDPPISLAEAGRRFGIYPSMLRDRYPNLCAAISSRREEWRAANAKARVLEEEELIRTIARSLVEQGILPSWRRLHKAGFPASRSWHLRTRLHEICKEVRLESNLK